ncbi:MAG: hypothetical protein LKI88_00715 [Bifidobacterium sp.]|jgi:hypothetical protein|nr:hypothetical protein [Bifidobacterium sp.]MCI1864452.1 hypothetical protein [Bifidobacterium sp.]
MSKRTKRDVTGELHAISEQLRIANLIALTQGEDLNGAFGQSMETLLREKPSKFGRYQLQPAIAEALGVTVDCEVEES